MPSSPLRPPPSTLGPGSTVWAYLRDSGGPSQDRSVEQQKQIIEEYCQEHRLILIRPPFKDIHKSGASTQARTDFNTMISLSASEQHRPQGLLIWNFARFARDVDDSQIYKSILRKRGIIIHSLTDNIPEGPFQSVIESMVHVADEQKKNEAAIGAWRGLHHLVRQGGMPGTPPRGFLRTPITVTSELGVEHSAHRWDPDPEWVDRIRTAFEMRAAGRSLKEIHEATRMYAGLNSYTTFYKNKLYAGVLEYGDLVIDDYCAPIISLELWDKVRQVQDRFAAHKHMKSIDHPRRIASEHLLSGLLFCARCKSPLFVHVSPQRNGKVHVAYTCTRKYRRRDCDLPRIPASAIEPSVIARLAEELQHPAEMLEILSVLKEASVLDESQTHTQRKAIEADLVKLKRKIANLTEALEDAGKSKSILDRLADLEAEEIRLHQQLADLALARPVIDPSIDPQQVAANAAQLAERLQLATIAEQRTILRAYIHSIIVDRIDDHIYATLKYYPPLDETDLPPPGEGPGPEPTPTDPTTDLSNLLSRNTVLKYRTSVEAQGFTHSILFEVEIVQVREKRKKRPA